MIYGYCRISTGKQSIERQIRNIKAAYPGAVIIEEIYTGTSFQGRDKLDKVIKTVKTGDSKRQEIKKLISELKKVNPFVETNIFKSVENVNLNTVIEYKKDGVRHNFLETYDD